MPIRTTQTKYGAVRGIPCGNPMYTVFKGIPYAMPTSGSLRFAPPKPPGSWSGERICDTFSDLCMQQSPMKGLPFGDFFLKEFYPYPYSCSENALCLNIWTPGADAKERLPVMFWIHGGGFGSGYSHEMEFDGEAFCKEGVILVSINYRLNHFGFFAHEELSESSDHKVSGNYGILDQVAALKWVNENIAAFGGDPQNVTIFGQSAGGGSVIAQLMTNLSDGLFAKAIIQSGGFLLNADRMVDTLKNAQAWGKKACDCLELTVDRMREIPADALMNKFAEAEKKIGPAPKLAVDGYVFEDTPAKTLISGKWKDIPVMVGSVRGDYALAFGSDPKAEAAGIAQEDTAFIGDAMIGWTQARQGRIPAYVYYFDPVIPCHDIYGFVEDGMPYHSSELWYIFGTLDRCWRDFDGRHYELSKQMIRYWSNFAKNGDPNGQGLPQWHVFTQDCREEMYFSEKGSKCRPVKNAELIQKVYLD